jgi:Homeodomain-like domain
VATAQKIPRRGRGRPAKLTDVLAIEIAALLLAGHSTTEVAERLGVSRRSIQHWRRRAWSRDERDAACVLLERVISVGRAAAVVGIRSGPSPLVPLDDLLRDLDVGFD